MSDKKENDVQYVKVGGKFYAASEKDMVSSENGTLTAYRKDYCSKLIFHMSQGRSFNSFAGAIGVGKRTIYRWKLAHSDFEEAYEVGRSKSLDFWEEQLYEGAVGETKANASLMIFKLKNTFHDEYKDKTEVEHKNAATTLIFNTGIEREGDTPVPRIVENTFKPKEIEQALTQINEDSDLDDLL